MSLNQISENLDIPIEQMRFLNPVYKLDIVPETDRKRMLVIPANKVSDYLLFENKILTTQVTDTIPTPKGHKMIYKVEKGDFLHKIAMKYNCSPAEIRAWNRMDSDFIAPGQTLIIWKE